MRHSIILALAVLVLSTHTRAYDLGIVAEVDLGVPLGQLRAVPVNLKDGTKAVAAMYGEDAEVDPYIGMFFFPKHTLKIALFDEHGKMLWKRDLGPGVVPGIWFSPIFAFDMDQDGQDEIYIVNNRDPEHPLDYRRYVLERVDARTGRADGQWPWPEPADAQDMSHMYRHFIMGGQVRGKPVLLLGQGTYGPMFIHALNADMTARWKLAIPEKAKGALGSHVTPVVDINGDGVDDLLWGERCIELDKGEQLFCADEGSWEGHSDIIQPVLDHQRGTWSFFTCRESNENVGPRVAMYDQAGRRLWADLTEGHIDTGWAARIGENGEAVLLGVKVGKKVRTAEGERRTGIVENTYNVAGQKVTLAFKAYTSIPVDLDGDGTHELVRGYFEGDGAVLDRKGNVIGNIGGLSAMASKFTSLPGEQILSYSKDGKVRMWADRKAADTDKARARYSHPFYKVNQKQTGNGYNLFTLGGI